MSRYAERRTHYRVHYPERATASLAMASGAVRVFDISETGLRFALADDAPVPEAGMELDGVLTLHEGRAVEIRVAVTRVHARSVSCRLFPPGIPLSVMFAEQRWLLRRYPLLLRATG